MTADIARLAADEDRAPPERRVLLAILRQWLGYCASTACADAIEAAGFRRAPGWIACSERMPDDEKHVLVHCDNGNVHTDWVDKDTGDFLGSPSRPDYPQAREHGAFATHWRPELESPAGPHRDHTAPEQP